MVGQHDLLCQFPFQNMPEIYASSPPRFQCCHHLPRQPCSPGRSIQASSTSPSKPGLHMSCVTASHWCPLKALHAFSWHWKQNPDSSLGYRHHLVLSNTWTVLSDLTHHVFSHVFLTGRLSPSCCFPQACFLPLFQSLSPSVSPCFSLLYNISSLQPSIAFCLFSSCFKPVSSTSNKVLDFPGGASDKESSCQCRTHKRHRFNPWVGKIPWRRARQPTPVFFPGEFHGQRSLAGYYP